MDEVGSKRGRPDPAPFYSAMRFVDKVVEVADVKISAQLLDILEAHFMHQTLKKRLLVGSEVQHLRCSPSPAFSESVWAYPPLLQR